MSPYGMALVGNELYHRQRRRAGEGAVHRRPDQHHGANARAGDAAARGPINHHWTKNVIANADGSNLYVTVGSNSNMGENGLGRRRAGRAAIWEVDTKQRRRSASSRAACATPTAWAGTPTNGQRAVDRGERTRRNRQRPRARLHHLGEATVPSTAGRTATTAASSTRASRRRTPRWRPRPSRPTTRSARTWRRWAWPSSRAGVTPEQFASGMFVGEHGSWNRKPKSGYKVVFVPFIGGKPSRAAGRRAHRFPHRRRKGPGPAGGRGAGQERRADRGGRRRQCGVAGVEGQVAAG
jgi:glucose/arabinose dehydrogenase